MKKFLLSAAIALAGLTTVALAGNVSPCLTAAEVETLLVGTTASGVVATGNIPYCQYFATKTAGAADDCRSIVSAIATGSGYQAKCSPRPLADGYKLLVTRYHD